MFQSRSIRILSLTKSFSEQILHKSRVIDLSARPSSYKSHLSTEKLYPNSDPDYLRNGMKTTPHHASEVSVTENSSFSGFIPIDELKITASKSSGPGGQSVNKVNSKVDVRFHLDSATWISDRIKQKLRENELGRITKDGFFVVKSDATRKQMLNQADCLEKMRLLIHKAAAVPKEPTKEDLKLKEMRINRAKAGVLREKRNRSIIKRSRSSPDLL